MGKARKYSDAEWAEARRLYEDEGWTAERIRDYFGMSIPAIYSHSGAEKWKKKYEKTDVERRRRRSLQERAVTITDNDLAIKRDAAKFARLVGEARDDALAEATAQELSRVMMLHRVGATRLRELLSRMFGELEIVSLQNGDLEAIIAAVAKARAADKSADGAQPESVERGVIAAFARLLGLDTRADIAKKIVDCMCRVVDMERRVYGIRDEVTETDVAKALRELANASE